MQVIFTAAAAGASAAALIVSSSTAGVAAVSVPLNGAALATSGLNVTPPQLTFAETLVGAMSAAQTVTVSNTSAVAATPKYKTSANATTAVSTPRRKRILKTRHNTWEKFPVLFSDSDSSGSSQSGRTECAVAGSGGSRRSGMLHCFGGR